MMNGPFYFIINPRAGGGKAHRLWPLFENRLKAARAEFRWRVTNSPSDVPRVCAKIDDDWIPVAVGGDGTLQALVEGLAPGRTIGLLPTGTTNDFARSVGISRSPAKALYQLLNGRARPIDLPTANGRPFLGVAGITFGSLPTVFGLPTADRYRSALSALIAMIRSSAGPREVSITVDGRTQSGKTLMIAIGNCRFFGGLDVCPLAHPDDGLLDLCVTEELTAAETIVTLGRLRQGTHVRLPKVHYTKAHTIAIDGLPTTKMIADGHALTTLPVAIGLQQQALNVVVPQEAWNPSKVTSILRRRTGPLDSGVQG